MKKRGRPAAPVMDRFWRFVHKQENGCWLWTGCHVGAKCLPYGGFRVSGTLMGAHRVAYERLRGRIPYGFEMLHSCHNSLCVNPYHLRIGTHQENMDDCKKAGRTALGNRSRSKLIPRQIREIRASNESLKLIAARFSIGQSTASRIKRREVWGHID